MPPPDDAPFVAMLKDSWISNGTDRSLAKRFDFMYFFFHLFIFTTEVLYSKRKKFGSSRITGGGDVIPMSKITPNISEVYCYPKLVSIVAVRYRTGL